MERLRLTRCQARDCRGETSGTTGETIVAISWRDHARRLGLHTKCGMPRLPSGTRKRNPSGVRRLPLDRLFALWRMRLYSAAQKCLWWSIKRPFSLGYAGIHGKILRYARFDSFKVRVGGIEEEVPFCLADGGRNFEYRSRHFNEPFHSEALRCS